MLLLLEETGELAKAIRKTIPEASKPASTVFFVEIQHPDMWLMIVLQQPLKKTIKEFSKKLPPYSGPFHTTADS